LRRAGSARLTTTGRAAVIKPVPIPAVPGDFLADLTLTGQGLVAKKPALGTATISGGLRGATWDITGAWGALTIGGTVGGLLASDALTVRTTGNMGAITLGTANQADFLAGVNPTAAATR